VAGIAALFLSTVVLMSGRGVVRYPFALFSLAMGVWGVLITAYLLTPSLPTATLFAKSYYIAAALLIYGFLLFCLAFDPRRASRVLVTQAVLLLLPVIAVGVLVFAGSAFIEFEQVGVRRLVTLHFMPYLVYSIYFLSYLIASLVLLLRLYASTTDKRRKAQVSLILKVSAICIPFGALFNLVFPFIGNYDLIMIGPLFVLPILIAVFYAMARYSLFDIRLVLARSTAYIAALAVLAGVYYLVIFAVSRLFAGPADSDPLSVGVALLLALFFQPIRSLFDKATNSLFFRKQYSAVEFYERLNKILNSSVGLTTLIKNASLEIGKVLRAEQAILFVYQSDTGQFISAGTKNHFRIEQDDMRAVLRLAAEAKEEILIVRFLQDSLQSVRFLKQHELSLVLPLRREGEVIGCLLLGEPQARQYTDTDIRVLETISDGLAVAMQNALSVQEVKNVNATLKERIEVATQELRTTNTQLQRLDVAKDEFVSMASHQLRTPLTSVKGYISMVLEGDAGKITGTQRQLLSEAFASSERMVHLINDFLNVSRLQTGKFVLERREVDFGKLVEKEVESLRSTARMHELVLDYRAPASFPHVSIDDGKIRQVIMNFIDNAIYYSREQSVITVSVAREGNDIVFEVRDTGIGVPKSEQARLFTKFYRASNARKQRPDGTGVGLFLAKKVVDAHGGSIVFNSIEGKGSTFGFRLPIEKLRNTAGKQADKLKQ
jgi:signal transduction histidine kinase